MTINEKILRLRKARSLTQAELGEKLGVTDKAVSKWEQGNGMPDLEQIQSLSDFFNVSLDYLLKDVARTTGDYQAQHDMEEQEKKTETKGKNDELRDKCKKYLEEQGIADFDEKSFRLWKMTGRPSTMVVLILRETKFPCLLRNSRNISNLI